MPKKLKKSIAIYLSKLKKIRTPPLTPTPSRLLSACKYPKTPSFSASSAAIPAAAAAATLSDVDRFLFENFHSLYLHDGDDVSDNGKYSPKYDSDAVKSSDRFFVSPATSSSLADDPRFSATSSTTSTSTPPPSDSVAVTTFSKDPYEDFRRSMQDMVDARHVDPGQPLDWDFMEELLFCYLELNDRSVHKYVLKAFTELTVSFRRRVPAGRRKVPVTRGRRRRRAREKEGG